MLGTADFDSARLPHLRALIGRFRGELEKLTWPLERLHALRDERLRALLRYAAERSPWHARRLRNVDIEAIGGDDLSAIPPMTKADLMSAWDEIVTDRRLTLDLVRRHLAGVAERGPAYLLDDYQAVATGGATGVFVWDRDGWLEAALNSWRHVGWILGHLNLVGVPARAATIAAEHAIHMTEAMRRTFEIDDSGLLLPVSRSLPDIVRALNAHEPTQLLAYPSMLHRLALEARSGRLAIAPALMFCGAEPLLPHMRATIESTFGAPAIDMYASSECGLIACSPPGSPHLHVAEDLGVFEAVDRTGRPVAPGRIADRLLVTNVINRALPLIRYELTDEVTFLDEPNPGPWTGRRIAAVRGRLDDLFVYADDVVVHPYVFWSALGRDPRIVEYQVRQTRRGAAVAVELAEELPIQPIEEQLATSLRQAGLRQPTVDVRVVPAIERHPTSGKIRRFVPIADGE